MGLDDTLYGTVRTNMVDVDPLLTLNRVYSILIQQERVNTITRAKEEKGEVFRLAVQTNSRTRERGEATRTSGVIALEEKVGLVARVRSCNNNNELGQALDVVEAEQYLLMLLKLLPEVCWKIGNNWHSK
ncbi:hypothetical protein KY284_016394 [Solanum tuberosum]|nr:hypothetical protein KY284_016394 [Solanum tuberosum]